jgi:hypothetical protein
MIEMLPDWSAIANEACAPNLSDLRRSATITRRTIIKKDCCVLLMQAAQNGGHDEFNGASPVPHLQHGAV